VGDDSPLPDRILVIDDEPDILNLAQMILKDGGYDVLVASNGEEAIQRAEVEMPDLILLDVVMPGKSGLEVCKTLKTRLRTRLIPIVMFTVLGRDVDRENIIDAGADGHFMKPFTPEGLLSEVKRQLEKARASRPAKPVEMKVKDLGRHHFKVAMLAWESLYTVRIGGLAVAATRLAEELAEAGHVIHFFTRRAPGQAQYMTINHVNYYTCVSDPGNNSLEFARNMSKALVAGVHEVQRYEGKFDVIHGHDWLVVDALHDLKNEGYPVVLTYHSTEYGRQGGSFGDWWEFKEISGKEWYGGYIANRVTTVSNYMKNELNWLYKIPLDKIEVIPNAIDPTGYKLNLDSGKIKEKYDIHPLAPMVGFIGRLESQKGPDLLVEAMPKVLANRWDAKFIFIGQGSMRGYLENRAKELGIADSTRFLDFVPYWHFRELINACDIICLPSRNEPFGIALLEAWAAGKPVVAADVGGLGENIDNFVNGIKVYTTPESVAWGINYLLNSPDAMKKLSEEASKKVLAFKWENTINKLVDTYSYAIGTRLAGKVP
jgi:glycogen(starch) synthase